MNKATLTPKQRVLKRWPHAWRKRDLFAEANHAIYRWVAPYIFEKLGTGPTPAAAWADAARKIA